MGWINEFPAIPNRERSYWRVTLWTREGRASGGLARGLGRQLASLWGNRRLA
jgi:hypothetical protein